MEIKHSYAAAFLLFLISLLLISSPARGQVTLGDLTLVDDQVNIDISGGQFNRRTGEVRYRATVTHQSGTPLPLPVYLAIHDLSPPEVTVVDPAGVSTEGTPYYRLGESGELAPGQSLSGDVTFQNSSRARFSYDAHAYVAPAAPALTVTIDSPETLTTTGVSPLNVTGQVSDPTAQLTINGAVTAVSNGSFQTSVNLEQGNNTIVARAVRSEGDESTDSIAVYLDMTPPYVTVESPLDGATVTASAIAVSGLVNDIVRGTISDQEANVVVSLNGQDYPASVSNRSYLAQNIPLTLGDNLIQVAASDQVGNTSGIQFTVRREALDDTHIELVDGQGQEALITETLPQPLRARLLRNGQPAGGETVVFRVTQGAGVVGAGTADEAQGVAVTTDADGIAQTRFRLGLRSGSGNHRVTAAAVGFDGQVVFHASALPRSGDKVSIISGNNQRGAVNQPLSQPLVVAVTDEGANLIPGATVEFVVAGGGGHFQNNGQTTYQVRTDNDGRASAALVLGDTAGFDGQRVTARIPGTQVQAGFTASAFQPGDPGTTSIGGVVLDNQDNPLPGVTVRVDGSSRQAVTDEDGQFTIDQAPVGPVHLLVDGGTTSVAGEWPTLSYNLVTVAGIENTLPGPIYLIKLDTENARQVGDQDVTFTLDDIPGFALTVKADSVTFPDGARSGLLSVTPVNADKVPMPPPNGMQPQLIVTIQPAGTRFDPPAPLTLPNVDGHLPGAQVEMYSYDHDLEEFVTIGLGTVSKDGTVIASNPGVGVIKAGWHCGSQPSGSGCAHNCGECQECDGDCQCVADDSKTPEAKCKMCEGGSAVADPSQDGLQCGDGPDQQCLLCDNGRCQRPDCDASNTTHSVSISSNNLASAWADAIEAATEGIPFASASLGLTVSGTETFGKECCPDCTKPNEETDYVELEGKVELKTDITFHVPGWKEELTIYTYRGYRVRFAYELGPTATISGTVGGSLKGHENIQCDANDCTEVSGNATLGLEGRLGGDVSFGLEEWMCLGMVDYDNDDCWDLTTGAGGKIVGSVDGSVSLGATCKAGTTCAAQSTCLASFNGITARFVAEANIRFVIISYTAKYETSKVLVEGAGLPCSCF